MIALTDNELSLIAGGDATTVAAVGVGGVAIGTGGTAMVTAATIISAPFIGGFILVAAGSFLVWSAIQAS